MFGAENNFRNIKNKVFFKEGLGVATIINTNKTVDFSSNPLRKQEQIKQEAERIRQEKEANILKTPNAQFTFEGKEHNVHVNGEDGIPIVANSEVVVLQPQVVARPRYVQYPDGRFYPVLASNGDVNKQATSLLVSNAEIDNAIREGAVMSADEYQRNIDTFDNNPSLLSQEGLKTPSNTTESISNARDIPELNVSLEDAVNQLDEQLKDVTSDIFTAAEYKIFTDQPALQDNREEVKQIISETVQKQRFEKGKGALGVLKNIASGFKNKAKNVWKVLDKDLTPKQVLGIVLLAGGMTAATLAALPVAAALAGGTLAGTAASYGAIGLAAGVGGNLAAAPFVASTASLVSAGIAAQGINMVRNRPKQVANVANAENSEVLTTEVSQTVETPAQAVAEVPKGFESNEFRETLNLVNLEDYGNGTQLEITAIVQDKPVIAKLQVITMPNGEKGLKFLNNLNTFVSVSAVDQADEHKGTIITGMDLKLKYLDGDGTQERTIKVDAVKITKEVVNSSQVEVVSNPESGNEKIAELANKVGEYEEIVKPLKGKLDTLDTAIKAMKDAGIDTSSAEKQKAELLKGTLDKENQVSGVLINLVPEIKKSQSISEQNRTPDQQKLVDTAEKAKQLGFNWAGGNELNQAVLVTGPSQFGNTKTEVKVAATESKPSVETRVESGNVNISETVKRLDEINKIVDNEKAKRSTDELIEALVDSTNPEINVREVLGFDKTVSNAKIEDTIKTALTFADIKEYGTKNSNLEFISKTSQSFDDGIKNNPQAAILKDYRGPGYDNVGRLVENLSMAKLVMSLNDITKSTDKFLNQPLDRDISQEYTINLLESLQPDVIKALDDQLTQQNPNSKGLLDIEKIKDLYNGKNSDFTAQQRSEIIKLPQTLNKLLKGQDINSTKTEINPENLSRLKDSQRGDELIIDTGDGVEQSVKMGNLNPENGTATITTADGSIQVINIEDIKTVKNQTQEKAKQDAEAKAKAEEEGKKSNVVQFPSRDNDLSEAA